MVSLCLDTTCEFQSQTDNPRSTFVQDVSSWHTVSLAWFNPISIFGQSKHTISVPSHVVLRHYVPSNKVHSSNRECASFGIAFLHVSVVCLLPLSVPLCTVVIGSEKIISLERIKLNTIIIITSNIVSSVLLLQYFAALVLITKAAHHIIVWQSQNTLSLTDQNYVATCWVLASDVLCVQLYWKSWESKLDMVAWSGITLYTV